MKTLALLFLMLSVGIAQGGDTVIVQKTFGNQSPAIIGTNKGVINIKHKEADKMDCSAKELYNALKDLSNVVELSTGEITTTLEYRTPASQLRRHAEEMERRDATIIKAREVLKRCGKYFGK